MLFIYYRITAHTRQFWLIKLCVFYTAMGFVATQLTLFCNCHPFSGYWTLPPPQKECATYFRFEVIQAIFNISSDLLILAIIIPILWKVKISKQDKVPLVFVFGLGFVVVRLAPFPFFLSALPDCSLTGISLSDHLRSRFQDLHVSRHL